MWPNMLDLGGKECSEDFKGQNKVARAGQDASFEWRKDAVAPGVWELGRKEILNAGRGLL